MNNETTAVMELPQLSEKQQIAWLTMAEKKNLLTRELSGMELQAQQLLLNIVKSDDYKIIDEALAAYRKINEEITATRLPFTKAIDAGIVQPLMEFEKRVNYKSNESYAELSSKSLMFRKIEAEKVESQNFKNQCAAKFKAFCANEFYRICEELRNKIRYEINNQYKLHLQERISPEIDKLKLAIRALKIPPTAKYDTPKFNGVPALSTMELAEIYGSLNKPEFSEIFTAADRVIEDTFANFDSDLANAAAAIKHQEEKTKMAELEGKEKVQEEIAITTLITNSEAVVLNTPKIKQNVQITMVNSEVWAKTIMMLFITNLPHLQKFIRVKTWDKLTVGQMAEYLSKYSTETGEMFKGVEYQTILK